MRLLTFLLICALFCHTTSSDTGNLPPRVRAFLDFRAVGEAYLLPATRGVGRCALQSHIEKCPPQVRMRKYLAAVVTLSTGDRATDARYRNTSNDFAGTVRAVCGTKLVESWSADVRKDRLQGIFYHSSSEVSPLPLALQVILKSDTSIYRAVAVLEYASDVEDARSYHRLLDPELFQMQCTLRFLPPSEQLPPQPHWVYWKSGTGAPHKLVGSILMERRNAVPLGVGRTPALQRAKTGPAHCSSFPNQSPQSQYWIAESSLNQSVWKLRETAQNI